MNIDLPIEVKKLIENLVLAGSSLGKRPSNASAIVASRNLIRSDAAASKLNRFPAVSLLRTSAVAFHIAQDG